MMYAMARRMCEKDSTKHTINGMAWNECECSESKNCIGLTHWRAHHRVLCRYCTCTLHTLNLEHEVRSRNDVYRNNNVCAQCAIIFVCFRCCCCFCWVGVCMSANVLHLWQQLQCKAGVQSRSAKQQRHKQHHQQQQQAGLPRITQKSIESAESNCN